MEECRTWSKRLCWSLPYFFKFNLIPFSFIVFIFFWFVCHSPTIFNLIPFLLLVSSPAYPLLFLILHFVFVWQIHWKGNVLQVSWNQENFYFILSLQLCTTQVNVALWLWWYCWAWKWHFSSKSQSCLVSVQGWTGFRCLKKKSVQLFVLRFCCCCCFLFVSLFVCFNHGFNIL